MDKVYLYNALCWLFLVGVCFGGFYICSLWRGKGERAVAFWKAIPATLIFYGLVLLVFIIFKGILFVAMFPNMKPQYAPIGGVSGLIIIFGLIASYRKLTAKTLDKPEPKNPPFCGPGL